MYRNIPEEEAIATVDAAWDNGVRYFDTAPLYGSGLAEIRLGEALSKIVMITFKHKSRSNDFR